MSINITFVYTIETSNRKKPKQTNKQTNKTKQKTTNRQHNNVLSTLAQNMTLSDLRVMYNKTHQ